MREGSPPGAPRPAPSCRLPTTPASPRRTRRPPGPSGRRRSAVGLESAEGSGSPRPRVRSQAGESTRAPHRAPARFARAARAVRGRAAPRGPHRARGPFAGRRCRWRLAPRSVRTTRRARRRRDPRPRSRLRAQPRPGAFVVPAGLPPSRDESLVSGGRRARPRGRWGARGGFELRELREPQEWPDVRRLERGETSPATMRPAARKRSTRGSSLRKTTSREGAPSREGVATPKVGASTSTRTRPYASENVTTTLARALA